MTKIKLILILCFLILKSDEITSSCKDYQYEECLIQGWKFKDEDKENALRHHTKAKNYINDNKLVSSFEEIVKARDIINKEQILITKMQKKIYSGSALRPRQKIYKTQIENTYDIKSLEMNASSKNTGLPLLIVECTKDERNIHLYNINKSLKDNKQINNMDLDDIEIAINGTIHEMDKVQSGDNRMKKISLNKCKKLNVAMKATNSLFGEKSIAKVELFNKGNEK